MEQQSERKKKYIQNVTALDKSNSMQMGFGKKNQTGILGITTAGGISAIGLTTFIGGNANTTASSNLINKSGATQKSMVMGLAKMPYSDQTKKLKKKKS